MRQARPTANDQGGFTLVELMAAALVLVVGMLGVLTMLHKGLETTTLTHQRVAATNLAREFTEAARQAIYRDLAPGQVAGALQAANPALGSGDPWTVKRHNTTYTATVTACAYDDPADKIAASPPDGKCADNPGGPSGDRSGDDFRRVSVSLSWAHNGRAHRFAQSTLVVNPTGGLGPRITEFTGPTGPITAGSNAHFDVKTTLAATLHWNADDGVSSGNATGAPEPYRWSIDWDLRAVSAPDAVLDGTYSIIAQAFDDRDIAGDSRVATVIVNRSLPFAPASVRGGHDTRAGDWVDLEWSLNSERDVVGYRVYWAGADATVGTADDQRVCPGPASAAEYLPNTSTVCADFSPPSGAARYYVVALDTDPATGSLRAGTPTTLDVASPAKAPATPDNPAISGSESPTLTWSQPASGAVAFYRIYRDGTTWEHRIGKATEMSFTDNGASGSHTYWVSAVNSDFNESALLGPFTWN